MEDVVQLAYSVDTLYFLVMGALVMFMAPGFAMLEAGMVRTKSTSEILTKNIALFSIASLMYLISVDTASCTAMGPDGFQVLEVTWVEATTLLRKSWPQAETSITQEHLISSSKLFSLRQQCLSFRVPWRKE